jgi:3-hydroxybutyryl-CoA dehydrogenase
METTPPGVRPRIVVVGAGTMGRGIAQVAAASGFHTELVDRSEADAQAGLDAIGHALGRAVTRGRVDVDARDEILARLSTSTTVAGSVANAHAVIEAVFEDVAAKAQVLRDAVEHAPSDALIATNTSALSITELAAAADARERLVGMHFFNPVPRMELVEVIRGLETGEQSIEAATALARRLGKRAVTVNEAPGFAVSRINALIGNEAFYMLMEGVADADDIDTAVKLGLKHPMGPFELGDLVGWDIRLRVLEHLHECFGEKFRPCPLLRRYVAAGRLGRKTGVGVFEYAS